MSALLDLLTDVLARARTKGATEADAFVVEDQSFSAQVRMVAPKSLPRSDYKSKLVDFSGAA